MRNSKTLAIAVALLLGGMGQAAPAWALSTGERLTQLEQQTSVLKAQLDSLVAVQAASGNGRQALENLTTQMQKLQEQIRELQGQIEVQQHKAEESRQLFGKQMEALERRVTLLEDKGAPAPAAAEAAAPVPAPTPPAAATPPEKRPGLVVTPPPPSFPASAQAAPAPVASTAAPARPAAVADNGDVQAYDSAFNLLKQGKYGPAVDAFAAFIKKYPGSSRLPNAYYWMGEAQYVLGRSDAALKSLQVVDMRFPTSEKAADALYRRAGIYEDGKQWSMAKGLYNQVITRYPSSRAAQQARQKLEQLKKAGH
ncbi:MAG: tol-pal system protein YbgF [Pseudomonadota bacterium]|uniref:tol-pal system protein YbgF n=1 Tax=Thermithiobacillus tepidarius TaxID=929 RepID=UPI00040CF386|nr:tol-pal system protein YbgF [Thermithiobacillus tepidarius]